MFRLTQLYPISNCENTKFKADVVFVHGLGGDAYDSWRHSGDPESFWPEWIGQQFTDVRVWSLAHEGSLAKFLQIKGWSSQSNCDLGYHESLQAQAHQVLDLLVRNRIGERPVLFVCHSLGGLLVKQVLKMAHDASEDSKKRALFIHTNAVLFLATPHHECKLATLLEYIQMVHPALTMEDLQAYCAQSQDLFEWYRIHASAKIYTRAYCESRSICGELIVDPTCADPGVGERPIPLDEDHRTISKPRDKDAQVYLAAIELLRNHVLQPATDEKYRNDIETLMHLTRATASNLIELSKLRVKGSEVKITRRCVQELRDQIENRSLVAVGEPGVGKSGALREVVASLLQDGRDVVFLTADQFRAETLSQFREQLGLQHELAEILANWKGHSPAFLVLDALDAVRSEHTMHMLLSFLAQMVQRKGRWRVLVSIRKFDLRNHSEIRNLFCGKPPIKSYEDPDFSDVCHIHIPYFSEDELLEIANQSADFKPLFEVEDVRLKEFVRVPFHLRLIGELLGEGVPVAEITSLTTQLELLDRYWEERVIQPQDGGSDGRWDVLRRAVSLMIEKRTLTVSWSDITQQEINRQTLDQMIHEHVLMQWLSLPSSRPNDTHLTFTHHVLFDYAVERLLLRVVLEFDEIIAEHPELIMIIRPSLNMHFQYLWSISNSRSSFWEMVLIFIGDQQIPNDGKKIGPAIAAESCEKLLDLYALLQYIDTWRTDRAEHALQYVTEALVTMGPKEKAIHLVGRKAGPWAALIERLSRKLSQNLVYIIRQLLIQFSVQPDALTEEQLTFSGKAARNLLKFVWSQEQSDASLLKDAMTCVCRMFHSNPDASSILLRRTIQKDHLARYGALEIPCIVRELKHIIHHDPYFFVRDLYIAAFGYEEQSEDQTRYQDYQFSLYQLGESFRDFIEQSPVEAVEALIAVIEQYVLTKHASLAENVVEATFIVNGVEAVICTDFSSNWDVDDHGGHDAIVLMLDAFQDFVAKLGMDPDQIPLCQQLVDLIVKHNKMASLWRRLLICGTAAPACLGQKIRDLSWSLPILTCPDTRSAASDFIQAVYGYLSYEEKEKVEEAIRSIPSKH